MKLTIKHEGSVQSGKLPTSFDELTVKQFLALEAGGSDLEILSVLSGIDLTYIENTKADLTPAMTRVLHLLNTKPPDLEKQKKKRIIIEGQEIKFPSTLDFTRYGQKSMVKNLIHENEKIEYIVAEVFAVYAQPIIDGKFISERIPTITKRIEQLPIIEVFPYAVFFFKKLKGLKLHLSSI